MLDSESTYTLGKTTTFIGSYRGRHKVEEVKNGVIVSSKTTYYLRCSRCNADLSSPTDWPEGQQWCDKCIREELARLGGPT